MFTGIVETMGRVAALTPQEAVTRIRIASDLVAPDCSVGDSVSVEGVCLTVVEATDDDFSVEAIPETLRVTSLGDLVVGDPVNLERALTAETRMGGHFVSGHVDGVGERLAGPPAGTVTRAPGAGEVIHWISRPPSVAPYLVPKGSVTVQGVSLTVVDVTEGAFSVALIPHTLEVTTLGILEAGGRVNLEADMIAKYVAALLEPWIERLRRSGVSGTGTTGWE